MQPNASRALAPAPNHTRPADPADSILRVSHSPLVAASPLLNGSTTGIRRASTACRSCKQIKRKCDQAHPCSNCRKSNTRCIYNEAEDGRRKAARKRTVENLELKRDALDSILQSFRSSSERHAQELLRLIRSNASLDEIVQYATAYSSDAPVGHFETIASSVSGQPRKAVMSVTSLCDTPLFQVCAKPWTSLTNDDDFVSHLVSVFFTWYHPTYPSIDQASFLRDMAAGNLDCEHCSPLLVNAMLSLACNFSDHPLTCRIPSDGSTRGQHFFQEATRLWSIEEGKPSLLNLQAISFLAITACLVGKDRLSWSYVDYIHEMSRFLAAKRARSRTTDPDTSEANIILSESLATWTGFLLSVGFGIAFMKPATCTIPDTPKLITEGSEQLSRWIPYPQQSPAINYPFSVLHDAHCRLHEIGLEIQSLCFGSRHDSRNLDIRRMERQLSEWLTGLPESLQLSDGADLLHPPIIDLHMSYHFFRMSLFSFIKKSSLPANSDLSPATSQTENIGDDTTPTGHERSLHDYECNAQERASSYSEMQTYRSAKAVSATLRRYFKEFGTKQLTVWMPQTATSAAYCLLDSSKPLDDPETAGIFYDLCTVITSASRRWLVMKGHVRMLLVTAEKMGQKLQPKSHELLKWVALDSWGNDDHKMFTSSEYPNYALARDNDPRLNGMGDLLEMWANVGLNTNVSVVAASVQTTLKNEHTESITIRTHSMNVQNEHNSEGSKE